MIEQCNNFNTSPLLCQNSLITKQWNCKECKNKIFPEIHIQNSSYRLVTDKSSNKTKFCNLWSIIFVAIKCECSYLKANHNHTVIGLSNIFDGFIRFTIQSTPQLVERYLIFVLPSSLIGFECRIEMVVFSLPYHSGMSAKLNDTVCTP